MGGVGVGVVTLLTLVGVVNWGDCVEDYVK